MKKLRCFYIVAAIIIVFCLSGCNLVQPVSVAPSDTVNASSTASASCTVSASAENTAPKESISPEQSEETPSRTPDHESIGELVKPDYDVQTSILWDLNNDGKRETISVGLGEQRDIGNDILLSVSDNGGFNTITVDSGYFESADYLITQGGALCAVVCISYEDDYSSTFIVSFDGLKPVLRGNAEGTVTNIQGTGFTVDTWLDVFGTWPAYGFYNVKDDFTIERAYDFIIKSDGLKPLVTKRNLPAKDWGSGEDKTVKAGTELYPYSTDGNTTMTFMLKDKSISVVIDFTISDHECFINGVSENDCFEEVPYAG